VEGLIGDKLASWSWIKG